MDAGVTDEPRDPCGPCRGTGWADGIERPICVPGTYELGKRSTSAATASGHEFPDSTAAHQGESRCEVANGGDARVASAGRAQPSAIDANALERMAKERPDECFLKGSGVLKLIGGIRQLEAELRALKSTNGLALPHRTHTTDAGESLEGIALRQLKDESRWVEIRDLNADRFPGMAAHEYYPVGTVLKLPVGVPGTDGGQR